MSLHQCHIHTMTCIHIYQCHVSIHINVIYLHISMSYIPYIYIHQWHTSTCIFIYQCHISTMSYINAIYNVVYNVIYDIYMTRYQCHIVYDIVQAFICIRDTSLAYINGIDVIYRSLLECDVQ